MHTIRSSGFTKYSFFHQKTFTTKMPVFPLTVSNVYSVIERHFFFLCYVAMRVFFKRFSTSTSTKCTPLILHKMLHSFMPLCSIVCIATTSSENMYIQICRWSRLTAILNLSNSNEVMKICPFKASRDMSPCTSSFRICKSTTLVSAFIDRYCIKYTALTKWLN